MKRGRIIPFLILGDLVALAYLGLTLGNHGLAAMAGLATGFSVFALLIRSLPDSDPEPPEPWGMVSWKDKKWRITMIVLVAIIAGSLLWFNAHPTCRFIYDTYGQISECLA